MIEFERASWKGKMITQARLKELLHYDPETGIWMRRARTSNCVQVGDVAGSANSEGYLQISICWKRYKAHRLAWLYMTGAWPKEQIDHANGDPSDNRWVNLRQARQSQNLGNSKIRSDNTSAFKGVTWHKRDHKWSARIMVNHKAIWLGYFDRPEVAHAAYVVASQNHFGEFARAS